jgi:hypothetical protein
MGTFQVYHLIPSPAAFVAMVIVTAGTIALALSQNAELLASFSLVGGFSTPVLLSTGQNHETVLFSEVCLLDIAIVAMTTIKPWRRLLHSVDDDRQASLSVAVVTKVGQRAGAPLVVGAGHVIQDQASLREVALRLQDWVQQKGKEWRPISCKRHQTGHLGFYRIGC